MARAQTEVKPLLLRTIILLLAAAASVGFTPLTGGAPLPGDFSPPKAREDPPATVQQISPTTWQLARRVTPPQIQRRTIQRPTIHRPTINRPHVERVKIIRPTIPRRTITRPTVTVPTIERPQIQRRSVPRPASPKSSYGSGG